MDFKKQDNIIFVIGKTEGHLDQSIFAKDILGEKKGPPPEVNLFNEKNIGETLLKLINKNLIESAHDVSLGGIIVAISKMCIKGNKGIKFKKFKSLINKFEYLFGEDQGRYIVEIDKNNISKVTEILKNNSVHFDELGILNEKDLEVEGKLIFKLEDLKKEYKSWLKKYMIS